MLTLLMLTPMLPNAPERLPDMPPLVPPRSPFSEAPQVAAPLIYVQKSTQWEYKQLSRNLSKEAAPTAAELNTLGKEGWELAGVMTDAPFAYFYFKRLADKGLIQVRNLHPKRNPTFAKSRVSASF